MWLRVDRVSLLTFWLRQHKRRFQLEKLHSGPSFSTEFIEHIMIQVEMKTDNSNRNSFFPIGENKGTTLDGNFEFDIFRAS